jgi:stage V sporulation protein G
MEITNVRVKKVENDSKLKAYASITFDESFVLHNVKVIQGQDAIFIAMPNRITKSGVFRDIAHPITSDFRDMLQRKVLEAYQNTNGNDSKDDSFNW